MRDSALGEFRLKLVSSSVEEQPILFRLSDKSGLGEMWGSFHINKDRRVLCLEKRGEKAGGEKEVVVKFCLLCICVLGSLTVCVNESVLY